MSSRRTTPAASAAARPRGHHSLAPAHLGEATAAATVAVVVGGIGLAITGIGMTAMALTIGARYAANPPPDVGRLGLLPTLGGIGLIVLGGLLAAGGVGVLARARRARLVTGLLSALAAVLSAVGVVRVMSEPPAAIVLAVALTVAALLFGAAAVLLLRPRR